MSNNVIIWIAVSTVPTKDEDVSLENQRINLLTLCENRNWNVIDILEVPTVPKTYLDFPICVDDMLKQGVDAFAKLDVHWNDADFDMLVVYDKRRFAQTQTLFAYIVEKTIHSGATIYSSIDGHIDQSNYHIWLNVIGLGSHTFDELKDLPARRQRGVEARLRQGLPANANLLISHVLIRDERTGKAIRVELNPETTAMWDDLAHLILAGHSWREIGTLMYEEFGYKKPNGKAYPYKFFYRNVYTPTFWGHGALQFRNQSFTSWVFDEDIPPPDGVTMYRNIYPSVWTGELAERIKDELRRREAENAPRYRPAHLFEGLFVCAECGNTLTHGIEGMWTVWKCRKKHESQASLKERYARRYIQKRLEQMVDEGDPMGLLHPAPPEPRVVAELRESQQDVDSILKHLERLLLKQAQTDDPILRESFDITVRETYVKFQKIMNQNKALWDKTRKPSDENRLRAYQAVANSLDLFWSCEPSVINQTLIDLMGKQRFVVDNGDIVGIAEV